MRNFRVIAAFLAVMLVLAACSTGGSTASSGANASLAVLTPIKLQLQWFPQAQFAGYFAALDKGYYRDEGFDVTILPGAVEIVPATVVAGGQAEFGISWVPRMLAPRESGADGVVIGQIFQRSPTLQVSFKDKNITKPEDLKGKKVGSWGFGNEAELYAGLHKAGIDPANKSDVNIIAQQFDMVAFGAGEIDAAQAMIYNEYAQVLETKNPKTGKLYTAGRPQRHLVGAVRHVDAPGRDLRLRCMAQEGGQRGHRGQVPQGVVQGLDLLPGQPQ